MYGGIVFISRANKIPYHIFVLTNTGHRRLRQIAIDDLIDTAERKHFRREVRVGTRAAIVDSAVSNKIFNAARAACPFFFVVYSTREPRIAEAGLQPEGSWRRDARVDGPGDPRNIINSNFLRHQHLAVKFEKYAPDPPRWGGRF